MPAAGQVDHLELAVGVSEVRHRHFAAALDINPTVFGSGPLQTAVLASLGGLVY